MAIDLMDEMKMNLACLILLHLLIILSIVWFFPKHINCIFHKKHLSNLPTSHKEQDTNVLHMGMQIWLQVLHLHFC